MAESVGDVIIDLRSRDVNMRSGLRSVEEQLGSLRSSLGGFRELTELGFGFHAGRMFFEKLHEGAVKGVEGFEAASKAGLGFSEALQDGIFKAIGMKTATEDLAKATKMLAESWRESLKAKEEFDNIVNPKAPTYGAMGEKDSSGMDKAIADEKAAAEKAIGAAADAQKLLRDYQDQTETMVKRSPGAEGPIRAERATGEQSLSTGLRAAEQESILEQNRLATMKREADMANAQAGINADKKMWNAFVDNATKAWESVEHAATKTAHAFGKEGKKAEDDAHKKHQEEAEKRYRENFEYHKRQGEKQQEQQKKDAEKLQEQQKKDAEDAKQRKTEAQHLADEADPGTKLADALKEIESLRQSHSFSNDPAENKRRADLAEKHARDELSKKENKGNKENKEAPFFVNADQFANNLLAKSLGGDSAVSVLKAIHETLKDQGKGSPGHHAARMGA